MAKLTEIRKAFERALEQDTASRMVLLATLSPDVRVEVEALLQAHQSMGAFLTDTEEFISAGERIGPYRILERIGSGGMGVVYRAERDDGEFQREVAIKFVGGKFFAPEGTRRFIEERRILAVLDHPNIVRMIDGGIAVGCRYLVMEFVSGKPVTDYCSTVSIRERLRLFQLVAAAVQYAHQHLVIHRDLKPQNILVTSDGQVKLLDFGIARLLSGDLDGTATLLRALTPEYASPEQIRGLSPAVASDIYSLGVVLHELLTGRRPYELSGKTLDAILAIVCDREIDQPGTGSADLDAIVLKALRKEPEQRYPSVEQLATDIQRYLDGRPVAAHAGSWLYRARKFVRRRLIPLAASAAVAIALTAGILTTWLESRRTQRRFNELRGLAHSLLFDIYDSVSARPGTLVTRRLVADRARHYLDSLWRDAGNDPDLARDLAESYLRLGDVLGSPYTANLGDTSGASESYQRAVGLLSAEFEHNKRDVLASEHLADAHMKLSRVLQRRGDRPGSIRESLEAIELLDALPPDNAARAPKLSRAYAILAEAQSIDAANSVSALQEALATSKKSLAVLGNEVAGADENWRNAHVASCLRMGYALFALGEATGDRSYYQQAMPYGTEAYQKLLLLAAAHPERSYDRSLADARMTIGNIRWKASGDFADAWREIGNARDVFQRLLAADPQNLELKRDLANSWMALGRILAESGQRKDALAAELTALSIYEDLGRADPASSENSSQLTTSRSRIAALQAGRNGAE